MNWVYYDAQIPEKTAKGEPNAGVLTAVLLCMADGYGDETGLAFRSVLNIAAMTRFDERTVRKAMRALESYGLIRESVDQSIVAAKVKRGDRRPTGYELLFDGPGDAVQNGGASDPLAANAQVKRGGERPPRGNGGASGPRRGGERPATGGRAAPQSQEELKNEPKGGLREAGTSPALEAALETPLEQNLESDLGSREPSAPSAHQTAQQPDPAPVPHLSLVRPASGELAAETPHASLPSRHCPRHPGGTSEPCGPCKDARLAHDTAEQAAVEAVKAARLQAEHDTRIAARLAAADCSHCDSKGQRHDAPFIECDHTPDQVERRRNGAARVRAAIADAKARRVAAQ
ncbi:hypothetical protein GS502_10815 [Rhodococcus hoagii]|nr:hypothetical protein [Prescottella equi]